MAKRLNDRLAALAANIASPRVVSDIDKALEEMRQDWLDLLDLRKMAVRRHGETSPPPPMPFAPASSPATAPGSPPAFASDRRDDQPSPVETLADLIHSYRTHDQSPYRKLRFRSRGTYDARLHRLKEDCGEAKLVDLRAPEIQALYDVWVKPRKIAKAHGLITMLRGLVRFGEDVLKDGECGQLAFRLHKMHFETVKLRTERLTAKQAAAIISKAHEMGLPSIALAQAFQISCALGQTDVIGEWVPMDEPGPAEIIDRVIGKKWARGLLWSEVDADLVLRHPLAAGGDVKELRLSQFPMLMAEFARMGALPTSGPVVISETTGRPYTARHFRATWRACAREAAVPDNIRSNDSRTGDDGIDETDSSEGEVAPIVAEDLTQETTRH